jgi:hypothetical protein
MGENTFTLKLTESQITVILQALGRISYSEVAPMFAIIGQQLNEQAQQGKKP